MDLLDIIGSISSNQMGSELIKGDLSDNRGGSSLNNDISGIEGTSERIREESRISMIDACSPFSAPQAKIFRFLKSQGAKSLPFWRRRRKF